MQRKLFASLCATAAVAAGITATSAMSSDRHDHRWDERGLSAVAVTSDQKLLAFRTDRPERAWTVGRVRGLTGGDARIVGVDYRPATGDLYGVGDAGGIYVIDDRSARATLRSRLNVPLSGTTFGVDFNPTVDRLRVVSDTGQNLRVNVDDGTTTEDADLNIPGPTPVNPALGVTAVGYTNNDADPNTATTLFDIDTTNDTTVIQAPPNAGSLNPTGKLGVDAMAGWVGFDIYSQLDGGTTVAVHPLASIATPDGASSLYDVDLLTGRVTEIGAFHVRVVDIAIPTDQR
jgi:Domain of unknown function (DUF4394)